ncbi:MAG: IclR family transcriptional regulator [Deltaproteobacteria bacterium]|nr:IclR family transcriptional regulator [Deltaproteobacteria bacterium]
MTKKNTAIEKALNILMAFVPDNQEMGTIEISKKLALNKATASRILLTLTRKRFLQQNSKTKTFKLGQSALLLGRTVINSLNSQFVRIVKPYMDRLRSSLNTSVLLEQMINEKSIVMAVSESRQRIRLAGNVGESVPIHAAVGAKAMLAFSDPETTEKIIDSIEVFERFTPKTITSKDELIKNLKEVKRNGYSLDDEETDLGIKAIGMPIYDYGNIVVGGLAVVFSAHRIGKKINPDILSEIKNTVDSISAELSLNKQEG